MGGHDGDGRDHHSVNHGKGARSSDSVSADAEKTVRRVGVKRQLLRQRQRRSWLPLLLLPPLLCVGRAAAQMTPMTAACPEGSFRAEGAADCTVCPVGRYQNNAGSRACDPSLAVTLTDLSSCSTRLQDGAECCDPVSRAPGDTSEQCCLPGHTQVQRSSGHPPSQQNLDVCTPCAAGKFRGGTCYTRAMDDLQPMGCGDMACRPCPQGTYSEGGAAECSACAAGKSSPSGGTSESACTECAAGQFSIAGSASACANCAPGMFSAAGASECAVCPSGRYQNRPPRTECEEVQCTEVAPGQAECDDCDSCCPGSAPADHQRPGQLPITGACCAPGHYQQCDAHGACSGACTGSCPAGKFRGGPCHAGNGMNCGDMACRDCPAGTFSQAGAGECTVCPPGQYQNMSSSLMCKDCPAGKFGAVAASTSSECSADCPAGTESEAGSTAQECIPSAGATSCESWHFEAPEMPGLPYT